jgi:cytochrome b6-f complex iron-sulfur subunit
MEKSGNRRQFLTWALSTGLLSFIGMLLYPVFRFIMPPPQAESHASSLKIPVKELPPGTAKIVPFGSKPVIVVRLDSGEFRALSAVCPHLNCTVQYRPEEKLIWCACHNGRFDLNGTVISGPPPSGLESFQTNLSGEELIISKA